MGIATRAFHRPVLRRATSKEKPRLGARASQAVPAGMPGATSQPHIAYKRVSAGAAGPGGLTTKIAPARRHGQGEAFQSWSEEMG